ncbi:hypothetical protein [Streptomyces sp. NPDC055013]
MFRSRTAAGVGALLASGLHQAPVLERGQQQVEHLLPHPVPDQARAGLGQHRAVEPGIIQLQAEGVFKSMPYRTRCAAARSVRFSVNCNTVTSAGLAR